MWIWASGRLHQGHRSSTITIILCILIFEFSWSCAYPSRSISRHYIYNQKLWVKLISFPIISIDIINDFEFIHSLHKVLAIYADIVCLSLWHNAPPYISRACIFYPTKQEALFKVWIYYGFTAAPCKIVQLYTPPWMYNFNTCFIQSNYVTLPSQSF